MLMKGSLLGRTKEEIKEILNRLNVSKEPKVNNPLAEMLLDSIKENFLAKGKYLIRQSTESDNSTLIENSLAVIAMKRLDDGLANNFASSLKENFYIKDASLFLQNPPDEYKFNIWSNCIASLALNEAHDPLQKEHLEAVKRSFYDNEAKLFKRSPLIYIQEDEFSPSINLLAYVALKKGNDTLADSLLGKIKEAFFEEKQKLFSDDLNKVGYSCFANALGVMALGMAKDPLAGQVCEKMKENFFVEDKKMFKGTISQEYFNESVNLYGIMALSSAKDPFAIPLLEGLKGKVEHEIIGKKGKDIPDSYKQLLMVLLLDGYYFGCE